MNGKSIVVAGAAAVLLLTGVVSARADESAKSNQVQCLGINSCKGQGACATAKNDCKGKNACKGQGMVRVSAEECKSKGGQVQIQKD